MDSEFFFNAALTCFRASQLFGYDPRAVDRYTRDLTQELKTIPFRATVRQEMGPLKSLEWEVSPCDISGQPATANYIYVRFQRAFYRVCLIRYETGAAVFANCSPTVLLACFRWFAKEFDTTIAQYAVRSEVLLEQYNRFMAAWLKQRGDPCDSQLIYMIPRSNKLHKITISVKGEDASLFASESSLSDGVNAYLKKHTAIDFAQLRLSRVNCAGFVLTSNGKLKLFKRSVSERDLKHIIEAIIAG
ncbi:hypothetical protein TRVA0_025S01420 [Trichomonascus vanleenenianus]|uniref:uncharacterized protein n=1 Tax=Trichomonascus vanleenenianus TaxID=2268995 RepID=UPI003EC9D838